MQTSGANNGTLLHTELCAYHVALPIQMLKLTGESGHG